MVVKETRPLFAPRTPDNVPTWPSLRNIDGYTYVLDSTHATTEAAESRRDEIRSDGDPAQVFSSSMPKFVPAEDVELTIDTPCLPRCAAVYTLPKGKMIQHNDEGTTYEVVINPKIVEREEKAAAKKAEQEAKKAEREAAKAKKAKATKKTSAKKAAKKSDDSDE